MKGRAIDRWFGRLGIWVTLALIILGLSWLSIHAQPPENTAPSPLMSDAEGAGIVSNAGVLYTKDRVKYPGIYVMHDGAHLDPAQYPGIFVGGNGLFEWNQIEPEEGYYNWQIVDQWIAHEAALGKRASLAFHFMEGGGSTVPDWVFSKAGAGKFTCTWTIPKYWDPIFLAKLEQFIKAVAERYDNDPRVEWIQIGTGIYGENQPSIDADDACVKAAIQADLPGVDPGGLWVGVVKNITRFYAEAFKNKPVMLQFAPTFVHPCERKWTTSYAASLGIGAKHNGLRWDDDPAIIPPPHPLAGCGFYDPFLDYGASVPTGWEAVRNPYMTDETKEYWGFLNGLDKHPDYINVARDLITTTADPDFLRFVNRHLGVTLKNTPSVWIALRETEQSWMPQWGDYQFWLYRRDDIPGGKTVPLWNVGTHKYGRYTRRTDQATGNPYMFFNVDDGYMYGGQQAITLTVIYYDQGNDRWFLDYDAVGGTGRREVRKTNTLTWKKAVFVIDDASFANRLAGGSDFRIDCAGDGDEIIHFVQVEKRGGVSDPTPTPNPFATPTPTWSPPTLPPSPTPTRTPTRTLTPAPGLGFYVTSLQEGRSGYTGARDTFINGWAPDSNYGSYTRLFVRSGDWMASLLYFDLRGWLSANAQVQQATLRLYVQSASNSNSLEARVFQMRRPWDEETANWKLARAGDAWGIEGANDINLDRYPVPSDARTFQALGAWYQFDVTEMVRQWVDDPASNYGLVVRGGGGAGVEYHIPSREYYDSSLRPNLVISYTIAPQPSPTATFTRTPSPTPTLTPTPTPTWTATPTGRPSPTPTPLPPQQYTVVLQQGNAGYTGTADTFIHAWYPDLNYNSFDGIYVRSGEHECGLIRFELPPSIPRDAEVVRARLELYVDGRTNGSAMELRAYGLLRPWNASQATWYLARAGDSWAQPGASKPDVDRAGAPVDTILVPYEKTWVSLDLTPLVAQWLRAPSQNWGVVLRGYGEAGVEYRFISSDNFWRSDLRPKLTITYLLPAPTPLPTHTFTPAASPTRTPTFTPSPTPTITFTPTWTPTPTRTPTPTSTPFVGTRTVRLQYGAEGYLGSRDTFIHGWYPKSNYGLLQRLVVRSGGWAKGLLYFDLPAMPSNAEVRFATLSLYVSGRSNAQPITLNVYPVSRAWDYLDATWEVAQGNTSWGLPGASMAGVDYLQQPMATANVDFADGWVTFDVTALVQSWAAQQQPNYGFLIEGVNAAGVEYYLHSSEYLDASRRPALTIIYEGKPPTPTPTPTHTATPTNTATPTCTMTPTPTLPPTHTPTVTPSATPTSAQEAGIIYAEAEAGEVIPPMSVAYDAGASACGYVISPENPIGEVRITFRVTNESDYWFWGRTLAFHEGDNSFFVSLDGRPDFRWDFLPNSTWTWQPIKDASTGQRPVLRLKPGTHSIIIRPREPEARLDAVAVVPASNIIPGYVAPCGGVPTATPTAPAGTATFTPTFTATATFTATPTGTPPAGVTLTPSATPTATPSPTFTATRTATATAGPTSTPTPTPTATRTPAVTPGATNTPTPAGTSVPLPTPTPAPYHQEQVSAVYNPDRNEYLVVWADCRNVAAYGRYCEYGARDAKDIYARRIGADGSVLSPDIEISANILSMQWPAAAYNPTNQTYLVVWQQHAFDFLGNWPPSGYPGYSQYGYDVVGRLINANGEPLTDVFLISEKFTSPPYDDNQWHPAVAYYPPANVFLVTWHDGRARTQFPSLFSMDENDRTTFKDNYAQIVSATGAILGRNQPITLDPANTTHQYVGNAKRIQQYTSIAYDTRRQRFLVVWEDDRNGAGSPHPTNQWYELLNMDIYGIFLDGQAKPIGDPPNFPISTEPGCERFPEVVYNPVLDEYLVVWQKLMDLNAVGTWRSVHGQRLDAEGRPIGAPFTIEAQAVYNSGSYLSDVPKPAAGVNTITGNYTVVWVEQACASCVRRVVARTLRPSGESVLMDAKYQVAGSGTEPQLSFNPQTGKYLVVFHAGDVYRNVKHVVIPAP